MAVDLTPGGSLRSTIAALTRERDDLQAQLGDLPGLYDELTAREDRVAELEATVTRLTARGIEDLRAANQAYRAALEKIVAKHGRGGMHIAQAALSF